MHSTFAATRASISDERFAEIPVDVVWVIRFVKPVRALDSNPLLTAASGNTIPTAHPIMQKLIIIDGGLAEDGTSQTREPTSATPIAGNVCCGDVLETFVEETCWRRNFAETRAPVMGETVARKICHISVILVVSERVRVGDTRPRFAAHAWEEGIKAAQATPLLMDAIGAVCHYFRPADAKRREAAQTAVRARYIIWQYLSRPIVAVAMSGGISNHRSSNWSSLLNLRCWLRCDGTTATSSIFGEDIFLSILILLLRQETRVFRVGQIAEAIGQRHAA